LLVRSSFSGPSDEGISSAAPDKNIAKKHEPILNQLQREHGERRDHEHAHVLDVCMPFV